MKQEQDPCPAAVTSVSDCSQRQAACSTWEKSQITASGYHVGQKQRLKVPYAAVGYTQQAQLTDFQNTAIVLHGSSLQSDDHLALYKK